MATPGPQSFVKSPPIGWVDSLRSIGPGVIPVALILFGGVMHAMFLPLLGLSVIYLFHHRGRQGLTPGPHARVISWVCSVIILAVVICTLYLQKGVG